MIKRQRKALLLIALTCLVMLVCIAQRSAGLRALVMDAHAVAQAQQQDASDGDGAHAPCELSAKSLFNAPPVLFEGALFALTLLLVMLAAVPVRAERRWPPRIISPPGLRVHLRLCVFRE